MKKLLICIILLISVGVFSWFNSKDLYSFYVKTWYGHVVSMQRDASLAKLKEFENDHKWHEIISWVRIHTMLFPVDHEARLYEARSYRALGKKDAAAIAYTKMLQGAVPENEFFHEGITYLYNLGYYGELGSFLARHRNQLSRELVTIYGISLYYNEMYLEALDMLKSVISPSNMALENYRYRGKSYEALGNYEMAAISYQEALRINARDSASLRGLIAAYTVLGYYAEAEKIIRRQLR